MHRNSAPRAPRSLAKAGALSVAAALSLACGSHDDVVATAVPVQFPAPSEGSFSVSDSADPTAATSGGTQLGGAPISGVAMATVPLAPQAPFVPPGALLVSGTPRAIPYDNAEPWPFAELLRDVFGVPARDEPPLWRIETDPVRVGELRRLGDDYGLVPGAAVMLVVSDEIDEQYDIAISEPD
jgi:hypothetical protein